MRRVVVTGLGAITPLGVGIRTSWNKLIAGQCGITSVANLEPQKRWRELPSTIAGIVPTGPEGHDRWRASDWLKPAEERRTSQFAQYAMAATDMALKDAGFDPSKDGDPDSAGVCLGSGIGNLHEIFATSLAYEKEVSLICLT